MIVYLIARNNALGRIEARRRGWEQVAYARFAGSQKEDIRLITRFADMLPAPNLRLVKAADFEQHPEAAQFEKFVADGLARWLE